MPTQSLSLAALEDVQAAYEETIPQASEERVQWLLDYATARLLRARPMLAADLAAGKVSAVLVTGALVTAVLRVLRNPGAYRSETAGEFSYTLNTAVASGLVAFTDEELADCSPLPSRTPIGVGSIRLSTSSWGGTRPGGDTHW